MKTYLVEITTYAVVVAEDEDHAKQVATNYKHDVLGDDRNPQVEVEREVTRLEDLEHGWDGECIPYGGDGNTRLNAILTANTEVKPTREAGSA